MTPAPLPAGRRKSVLVDSNLLLLLFVGDIDPLHVRKFKRTQKYSEDDYWTLHSLLAAFETVVTTPNILTETSNLGGALQSDYRWQLFNRIAMAAKTMLEEYRKSMECAALPMFGDFGLADTAAFSVAGNRHLLLTDDSHLAQYAGAHGVDVIDFNYRNEWQKTDKPLTRSQ